MEKMYNINQASDVLGIKVRTVREWIKTGKLHAVKYNSGYRWFIPESEIKRVIGEAK